MIVDFLKNEGPDLEQRYISQILNKSDDYFEASHDYIQWLFPLKEPSNFNPNDPILTDEQIKIIKACPKTEFWIQKSFSRFLAFLGLQYEEGEVVMLLGARKNRMALMRFNHNFLRITRVLKSLTLLGFINEANAFYDFLWFLKNTQISENSFAYWEKSISK